MPIPTIDTRTNFKEYIRYFKEKFTSQIQTIDLQYIRGMFTSEDTSLPNNTSVKFIVFDNAETIDVSTEVSSNEYLYIPALYGDSITLKFNSEFYDFSFEQEDGGIIYDGTKYGLNNQFQVGEKQKSGWAHLGGQIRVATENVHTPESQRFESCENKSQRFAT